MRPVPLLRLNEIVDEDGLRPYLELFARERRPGWTSWGDQLDRFEAAA